MALVLALLVGGPLAPLAAAPQTQPAASAEPNQGASSMPSATMEQDQAQQQNQVQLPQPQAEEQNQAQPQAQQQPDQPAQQPPPQQDQPQQLGVGQSQPPAQETPGVVTQPPPAPPAGQTPVRASQPDQFKETVKSTRAPRRGSDGYDAAAVVVNIGRPPLKAVLCGLGVVSSAALFALTFGSASRAATAAVAEGCGGKWFVNGDDLRPEGTRTGSFEWETHQFDWERR
ncbi:MAG TPA: hypothetical protein VGL09_16490 [Methylomirabilota bacterium]|jgi:outer membrane biosynthesis protein TonB